MTKPKVLVIGAGVIGLTSAIKLAEAGYGVTIWTKNLTTDTTSAKAGAFWEPYACEPKEKALPWAQTAYNTFKRLAATEPESGVIPRISEIYLRQPEAEPWWRPIVEGFDTIPEAELPTGYKSGWHYSTFIVDTSLYLPWLVQQVQNLGIKIEQHDLANISDAFVSSQLVVNCSGLGARELCGDQSVYPVRGQVVRVAANGLDKILQDEDSDNLVYIVPRTDDIIIGGTLQENDWNTMPDPQDTAGILERARKVCPELADAQVLEEKVGLRPARDAVRVEIEKFDRGAVIHNYGHGGVGYSLSWGCAENVIQLANSLN